MNSLLVMMTTTVVCSDNHGYLETISALWLLWKWLVYENPSLTEDGGKRITKFLLF